MDEAGYAVVRLEEAAWSGRPTGPRHAALTDQLGATETGVDAYRLRPGDTVWLDPDREHLLIPVDADSPLSLNESVSLPPTGIGRVPAGVGARIRSDSGTTLFLVSVPAEAEPDDTLTIVDLEGTEFTVPETSDVATAFLTGPLGSVGMKANARRLEPGQAVPYHTEGQQEELFIPLHGPASMRIADETCPMPVGSLARVAPEVPRSAVNDGETDALWIMVGAPPTGGPTDWDPGAKVVN